VKSHLQQAVFGVVSFSAFWARDVAAPGGTALVVVFGDRERLAAAAGEEEHAERRGGFVGGCGLCVSFYGAMFHGESFFRERRRPSAAKAALKKGCSLSQR
jgi:hypothetical protein